MPPPAARPLPGPNVWSPRPVLELTVTLPADGWPADRVPDTLARLANAVGFAAPVEADPAAGLAAAAVALQTRVGSPVAFFDTRPAAQPGVVLAAVEYADEAVGRAAVEVAWRLLEAARDGRDVSLDAELAPVRDAEYAARFPVSTAVSVTAANARGIPVARLSPEYSRYVRLGQGSKQRRLRASEPDSVSGVARMAATDKHLAKHLLRSAGVPVPDGRLVSAAGEAVAAAVELGYPVAVKPVDADLGTGVSLDLRSPDRVEAAFAAAAEHSGEVLVERFAPGVEHRVLVVAGRVVAVTRVDPPQVVGDGTATVAELVARVNADPRRTPDGPRYPIALDDAADRALAAQGFGRESVPPAGARVLVRRDPPYFKHGGAFADVTDAIHPANAAHAAAAAAAVGLPVAGLDVVALDIGRPLEEQAGVVVEINPSPGLWLHLAPWNDSPRPVGEAIVASLFPPGDDGRIPAVAVVGDRTGACRAHLAALLASVGVRAGAATADAVEVGGRRWPAAGGPRDRAELLMQNPTVDVAVLETTPAELVRHGFGADRCTVAVVLDPDAGPDPAAGEFPRALRHAMGEAWAFVAPVPGGFAVGPEYPADPGGRTLVLPGADPGLVAAAAAALALGVAEPAVAGYLRSAGLV